MSFLEDVGTFIGKAAPMLGTALGGPFAGQAIHFVTNALGLSKDAPEDEIKQAFMNATPDQIVALKKAEQDFAVQMAQMGYKSVADLEKIAADDRANARDREIKTGDSWTPRILAAFVVLGWLCVQWFIMSHIVPTEMQTIVVRSMGTLDMALGLVLGYYFGSSAGSRAKDETIKSISK